MIHAREKAGRFGLLELMVAVVIVGLLATIALPAYDRYVERARTHAAIAMIARLEGAIEKYRANNNFLPPETLAELPGDVPLDPWGNPYGYENIETAGPGKSGFRKDGNLNSLNTDFDLYSSGKDGDSKGPLNSMASRDDVVRANNGAFIGRAADY